MLYFKINNRRYTGSKFKLLKWIEEFPQKEVNAVYISPIMHQDGILVSRLMSEDRYENVSIYPSNIEQFIEKIETDSVLN